MCTVDINPIILLTKVDEFSQVLTNADQTTIYYNKIYRSKKVLNLRKRVSDDFHVSINKIFPFINYVSAQRNDPHNDAYILFVLRTIQERGIAYQINKRNTGDDQQSVDQHVNVRISAMAES